MNILLGQIPFTKSKPTNQLLTDLYGFAAALSVLSMQLTLLSSNLAGIDCIYYVFVINLRIFFSYDSVQIQL